MGLLQLLRFTSKRIVFSTARCFVLFLFWNILLPWWGLSQIHCHNSCVPEGMEEPYHRYIKTNNISQEVSKNKKLSFVNVIVINSESVGVIMREGFGENCWNVSYFYFILFLFLTDMWRSLLRRKEEKQKQSLKCYF